MTEAHPILIYMDALTLGRAVSYDPEEPGTLPPDAYYVLEAARSYCPSRVVLTQILRTELRRQFQGPRIGLVLSGLRSVQTDEVDKVIERNRRVDDGTVTYVDLHRNLVQDALAQRANLLVTNLRAWLDHSEQIQREHGLTVLRPRDAVRTINQMRGSP